MLCASVDTVAQLHATTVRGSTVNQLLDQV
jgi:hypothetical protein